MNTPKSIQEILFLQVAKCQAGKGVEEIGQSEVTTTSQFDTKGVFVERGLLEFSDEKLVVPFVRHTTFGKPRRRVQAVKKVSPQ